MKRTGIKGIIYFIPLTVLSPSHTGRYVNEFAWRLNDGNVRRHTTKRLDSLVERVANRRLTYKRLVAK